MSNNNDLFSQENVYRPLADRMRPSHLDQFFGQAHILREGQPLRQAVAHGHLHSMIFWGPPGTGKTTLAKLIASSVDGNFISLSAVLCGVKDIRAAIENAQQHQAQFNQPSVLFVDEVHRFNKAQQDAFLPHIENGTIFFIGATTENPAFELNNALLSRARVYVLKPLNSEDMLQIIDRALTDEKNGLAGQGVMLTDVALQNLADVADGDGRRVLNLLETAADFAEIESGGKRVIDEVLLKQIIGQTIRRFDKGGDAFYDMISALHKSIRGSNPDGALYWFTRMLDGGCDPLYIARRMVRIASEDIGNADPRALSLALNAWDVQERLGSPEGELAIAQSVTYLACAPKSNAVYMAYNEAKADAKRYGSLEVPSHLRNAPTNLAKSMGYGEAYRYAHNEQEGYAAGEKYLPEALCDAIYYRPVARGLEIKIAERLARLAELDRQYELRQKELSELESSE